MDYFAADGASGFDDLIALLNQYSHLALDDSFER